MIDKEPVCFTAEEADAKNNGPNKKTSKRLSKRTFKEDRARQFITWMLCQKYEMEVKRFTVNGRLPIANGIRADAKTGSSAL